MLKEILLLAGITIVGGIGFITLILYLIFKKNFTVRLWTAAK